MFDNILWNTNTLSCLHWNIHVPNQKYNIQYYTIRVPCFTNTKKKILVFFPFFLYELFQFETKQNSVWLKDELPE